MSICCALCALPSWLTPLVGPSGLEPPTSCLSGTRSNLLSYEPIRLSFPLAGGDDGIRTHDPLLAGQVLSQLSYTPIWGRNCSSSSSCVGLDLSSRIVSNEVLSALQSLTSVFGMGTGGPSAFVRPTIRFFRIDP